MWKDFHHTILPFLEEELVRHKMVKDFNKIETANHILYKITRNGKKDITIWVSDAYWFNINHYYSKPEWIDFIYVAKPETSYSIAVVDIAKEEGINIGKFWALMWILHTDDIENYIPQERRKQDN